MGAAEALTSTLAAGAIRGSSGRIAVTSAAGVFRRSSTDRAVAEGSAGAAERAAAAEQLWRLRAEHVDEPPLEDEQLAAVLAGMSG